MIQFELQKLEREKKNPTKLFSNCEFQVQVKKKNVKSFGKMVTIESLKNEN